MYGMTYGMVPGMVKTTVYMSEELKKSLERLAAQERRSEAELIREALQAAVESRLGRRPRFPLTGRGLGSVVADRVDELLSGFGAP